MKKYLIFTLFLALSITAIAQDKPAYVLYDSTGGRVTYAALLEKALQSEVVLFGELHNNPISHWLQLELTRDLYYAKKEALRLGAEMFEADNQLILNEYLAGVITERNFTAEAKLWNNYQTDYKPLIEFAREHALVFIATNIPRRYASVVNRQGFEGLENLHPDARQFIAPLPVAYDPDLPAYKAMLEMGGMPGHVNENFPKAQAIKDATMAHFIYQHMRPESVFLHFHGAYHSNHYEGIMWYLKQLNEKMTIVTISTVEQGDPRIMSPDHLGLADFIIVVPTTMTKTY
jgi:uncharacterized iron-regulated protein